jgi:DNA repair exonuclease SbcCD nuclease subunit
MDALKFITFTDVHISSINPESRIGDYETDIIDKLKQIKSVGEKLKVDFFLFAGDLFQLKAPMKNPHALNTKLIELFKSYPAPIYATEGNHDLRNDSYETFDEQPLRVIYSSGALTQARDVRRLIKDIKVRIRSFPFKENPDFSTIPNAKDGTTDLDICLLHLYSTSAGGALFHQKLYSYEDIAALGDDIFVLGHYHIDQGIETKEIGGRKQTFVNVGAVSRGSYSEEDISRVPKISFFSVEKTDTGLVSTGKVIRLNVRPYTEVFDVEQHKEDKKKVIEAEAFVAKLQSDLSVVSEGEDRVKSEIMSLDIDKAVLAKVLALLEEADVTIKGLQ